MRFVNSVINDFESKEHECNENERVSKQLLKKLKAFTKEKHDLRIVWKIKTVRQLFLFKGENAISFM